MGKKEIGEKKPFFRRLLIFFVAVFAFIALIATALCAISPHVSPDAFVWTSYFGLAFWLILFADVLLFVTLIFLKARKSLMISLLAFVVAMPGFMRSCSVKKETFDPGNIKMMSYNVAFYHDVANDRRTWEMVYTDVIHLIRDENPDIVCLQESGPWSKDRADDFGRKIGCKYHSVNKFSHRGNIIFSRFPLEDDEYTERFNASGAAGFVKVVKAGSLGRFYLQNTHLQSYNITKDEIEYLGDTRNYVENSSKGKSVFTKLRYGFEERTKDTKIIVGNLPGNDMPVIICGDFNDTPLSYTYQQMKKAGFSDAFLEAGHGVGKTYCGKLPLLRIDYFWHDENVNVFTFKTITKKMSDHYPIVMTFNVSN
ncbi:MAG: endonuclease/exonuclease/phosphatase family protein [bacterium]|nr:endonuclease/exonuclease/phosphatase family protein [Candidatus Limimorpha caballi]